MIDLIVFSIGNNRYALNIENIQRIIQTSELTDIPNAHKLIDGMMSYENKVIKVLNFRRLIGLFSYEEEVMADHKNLHAGMRALELSKSDKEEASKLVIYEKEGQYFAIKVDSIVDIVHIDESKIIEADKEHGNSEFLQLQGVMEIDGVLTNIIKTLNIPK